MTYNAPSPCIQVNSAAKLTRNAVNPPVRRGKTNQLFQNQADQIMVFLIHREAPGTAVLQMATI